MAFQKSERITITLPPDEALWLRGEAKREHTTLGGLILAAVKAYRDRKVLEDAAISAHATLMVLADAWARGDADKARDQVHKYRWHAKRELNIE